MHQSCRILATKYVYAKCKISFNTYRWSLRVKLAELVHTNTLVHSCIRRFLKRARKTRDQNTMKALSLSVSLSLVPFEFPFTCPSCDMYAYARISILPEFVSITQPIQVVASPRMPRDNFKYKTCLSLIIPRTLEIRISPGINEGDIFNNQHLCAPIILHYHY